MRDRAAVNPQLKRHWLIGLLVIAAAVRVGSAVRLPCIAPDGVFFVTFAKQLAEKPRYYMREQKKQPGYSAVLLAVHRIVEGRVTGPPPLVWQACGQGIAAFGGLTAVWLIFTLTRRCFDETTALVATALAALWPQGVELSADVLSDMPHLAVYLAGLLIGLRVLRTGSLVAALSCGALGGVAYLFRQEGLGLPVAVALAVLWTTWKSRTDGTESLGARRAILQCLLVGVGFVVAVAPYALAIGRWMNNKTLGDLLFGPEEIGRITAPAVQQFAAVVRWWDLPLKMAEGWARSGRYVFSLWAIVGMAWTAVPRCETNARRLITAAVMLQLIATALRGMQFGEVSGRYITLPAALCIPWAAAALVTAWRRFVARDTAGSGRWNSSSIRAVIGFSLIAIVFVPLGYYVVRPHGPAAAAPRQAGAWLRTIVPPQETILMEPKLKQTAFYADRESVWPPETQPLSEFLAAPPYQTTRWFLDRLDAPPTTTLRRHPEADALRETLRERAKTPLAVSSWTALGLRLKAYELSKPFEAAAKQTVDN